MRIELGKIARDGIEIHHGGDPVAAVRAALRFYAERLASGVPPPPRSRDVRSRRGYRQSLELALDPETQAALERQALASSISAEDVAAHAVLVYLAEVDAISIGPDDEEG